MDSVGKGSRWMYIAYKLVEVRLVFGRDKIMFDLHLQIAAMICDVSSSMVVEEMALSWGFVSSCADGVKN